MRGRPVSDVFEMAFVPAPCPLVADELADRRTRGEGECALFMARASRSTSGLRRYLDERRCQPDREEL